MPVLFWPGSRTCRFRKPCGRRHFLHSRNRCRCWRRSGSSQRSGSHISFFIRCPCSCRQPSIFRSACSPCVSRRETPPRKRVCGCPNRRGAALKADQNQNDISQGRRNGLWSLRQPDVHLLSQPPVSALRSAWEEPRLLRVMHPSRLNGRCGIWTRALISSP
ncbi:hypothetical protein D3C86_1306540 [compost metagenome]